MCSSPYLLVDLQVQINVHLGEIHEAARCRIAFAHKQLLGKRRLLLELTVVLLVLSQTRRVGVALMAASYFACIRFLVVDEERTRT